MTFMAMPLPKNPCPWGHEIGDLVDPSMVIITIYLSLSDLSLGVQKKIFKEIMQFNYLPLGWGHKIYHFLSP